MRINSILLWGILIFLELNISAQNLIPNSSFEQYITCPYSISQLELSTGWIQPTAGSADYYHGCSTSGMASTPGNNIGYQVPHSGVAYAGIFTYIVPINPSIQNREYIEAGFTSPLVAGTCYYFELYANLVNKCKYTLHDLGIYFSDTLVDGIFGANILSFTPQIENPPTNLFDTLNWTLVSGYYTAHGGEQYVIIGNFNGDSVSVPLMYNPTASYGPMLLIDDVSLTVCTGMEEFNKLDINIAPNPFTDKLTITAKTNEEYELMLTDITGRQVLKQNLSGNATVQTGSLGKGIYFATLRKKVKVVTAKVVKQ